MEKRERKSMGRCVACLRETYGYHGEECPDWRCALGNATYSPLRAFEYDMQGDDVALCALCANTREDYERGLAIARKRWSAGAGSEAEAGT